MRYLFVILTLTISVASDVAGEERFHGRVEFKQVVPMGITMNGLVSAVNVKQGDYVKKGTTLITLDDTPYQARKEKQHAAMQQALIEQRKAKRDYMHAQELYNRASLSSVELDDADLKLKRTNASVANIRAELRVTNYEISQCRLIAPFDGWVLQVNASEHEASVNHFQSKPLVTIAEVNQYAVYIDVPLVQVKLLSPNTPVKIVVNGSIHQGRIAGKSLTGVVHENKAEPYYPVRIEFVVADKMLLGGEIVEVNL